MRDAGLVDAGEDFDAVHGTVSDKNVLMCRVVDDAAMARLSRGIIERGDGIGAYVGGARKVTGSELHGERQCRGVR